MKKLWSCLCFLVLAVLPISSGQSTTDPQITDRERSSLGKNENNTTPSPMPSSSTQNSTTSNETDLAQGDTSTIDTNGTRDEFSTLPQTTVSGKESVSTTAMTTSLEGGTEGEDITHLGGSGDNNSSSWGYVILVLIILVIIILCVILYLLRRVSRTYSFDLQRPSPANRCNEPIGTFEPVHLDDLDLTTAKDLVTNDYTPSPTVANGTTPQPEDKDSDGENALQDQDQTDTNGVETLSIGINSPPADIMSDQLMNTDIFFSESREEQQNENNNNPSVCSSDPFVEINLDEPVWCDQLLTSSELPSSVHPLSFSSSSSTSSSSSS